MTRVKKFVTLVLALALAALFGIVCHSTKNMSAKAATVEQTAVPTALNEEEATPYGLITNLTFALDGGNGEVWVTAKNSFTLFPAAVNVIVELYYSYDYQDSYTNMTLAGKNSISDLNMGSSIEARASTDGQQRYWKGRMYYKIDNKDWQEKVTDTVLYDGNGVVSM